jgi:hypothetical protein
VKYILVIIFSWSLFMSCSPKKSTENNRIEQLSSAKSTDEFMSLFLKFIKDNKLEAHLIQYENELIESKKLEGPDDAAYQKYFNSIIQSEKDDRCISKASKENLFKLFFSASADFKAFQKKFDADDNSKASKEFNFLQYISDEGGLQFKEALEYALLDNPLTLEKKYFYLIQTAPFKTCP